MERPRFELEWVPPQELGLMTHVTLFDAEWTAPYALAGGVLAMGHGVDEADTLLDRWTTLVDPALIAEDHPGVAKPSAGCHKAGIPNRIIPKLK